jgi:ubiquinone/menaquinone biosynthesis C-methylase UbiE
MAVIQPSGIRPFAKYERFGAYHWREIGLLPTRHNAILTARYAVLLDALDLPARHVLDIGCGDGTLTFQLSQRCDRVWGVDDALLPLRLARGEFARRRAGHEPRLARADARRLPFAADVFDCVVLADVIEHIDDAEEVIHDAYRVLRRGGQILITTPRRQGAEPGHEYHRREYIASELSDLLRQRFTEIRVQAFQPIHIARLYERKILGRKLFRIAINCCAILGWNPLRKSGDGSAESRYTDLCASGRKP